MTPRWVIPVAVGVALLVAGSLVYQHFANRGVSPAVRDSLAVLKASKRPDSVAHAALVTTAATAVTASVAHSASATATERRAAQNDSLAKIAAQRAALAQSAHDSAELWRQAYGLEQRRGDSLEAALILERRASESARLAAFTYQRADSASQDRLVRVERLNASLVGELDRVASGCHLLPFVRCPTRKETAVIAAAATYLTLRQTGALK